MRSTRRPSAQKSRSSSLVLEKDPALGRTLGGLMSLTAAMTSFHDQSAAQIQRLQQASLGCLPNLLKEQVLGLVCRQRLASYSALRFRPLTSLDLVVFVLSTGRSRRFLPVLRIPSSLSVQHLGVSIDFPKQN